MAPDVLVPSVHSGNEVGLDAAEVVSEIGGWRSMVNRSEAG